MAAPFGIVAIVQALALTAWVMPLAVWWLSKVALFRMRDYARNMLPILLALVLAIAAGRLVEAAFDLPALVRLGLAGVAAMGVYGATAVLADGELRRTVLNAVRTRGLRRSVAPVTTERP